VTQQLIITVSAADPSPRHSGFFPLFQGQGRNVARCVCRPLFSSAPGIPLGSRPAWPKWGELADSELGSQVVSIPGYFLFWRFLNDASPTRPHQDLKSTSSATKAKAILPWPTTSDVMTRQSWLLFLLLCLRSLSWSYTEMTDKDAKSRVPLSMDINAHTFQICPQVPLHHGPCSMSTHRRCTGSRKWGRLDGVALRGWTWGKI